MTRNVIDRSALAESSLSILNEIRDNGGDATLLSGATGLWDEDSLIRTGSLALDMSIGVGGLPRGKFIEISGEESSGKTTLALHIAREAQARGLNVVYYDSENALDPTYCTLLGVDLESMIISQPDNLEQGLSQMIYLMEQKAFDGLIVLDSIPNLLPKSMMEADPEAEGRRAAMAAVYSRVLPRLKKAIRESNATAFFINQTRDAMADSKYKPQTTTPGGKALKFAYDLRLDVKRQIESDQKRQRDGIDYQVCLVTVIKNKVGSPFKTGEFVIWKDGTGINWQFDVIEAGIEYGGVSSHMKFADGEFIKKKHYYSIRLDAEIWGKLNEEFGDEIDMIIEDVEMTNEETGEIATEEVIYIQKYNRGPFIQYVSQFPTLIEYIEDRTLMTLDKGAILNSVNLDKQAELEESISSEDNSEEGDSDGEE